MYAEQPIGVVIQKIYPFDGDRAGTSAADTIQMFIDLEISGGSFRANCAPAIIPQTETRPCGQQFDSGLCDGDGGDVVCQNLVTAGVEGRGCGGFSGAAFSEEERGIALYGDGARVKREIAALAQQISHEPACEQSPYHPGICVWKQIRNDLAAIPDMERTDMTRISSLVIDRSKRFGFAYAPETDRHVRIAGGRRKFGQFYLGTNS